MCETEGTATTPSSSLEKMEAIGRWNGESLDDNPKDGKGKWLPLSRKEKTMTRQARIGPMPA